ncbi:Polypeptide N-acetylgalactosaminyltransferase [Aphelenchoides fujianensis]|nr:Polypeptide N-acetylgalactosaminyltransferase [Aphelenchoides fujianensis]
MPLRLSRYIPRKFYTGALYVFFVVGLLFYYLSLPSKRSLFSSEHVLPAKPLVLYGELLRLIASQRCLQMASTPSKRTKTSPKKDWHDYAAMKADEAREGPGEGGKPLAVSKDDEKLAKLRDEIYRQNGYDGYASDQIALNRSIKDIRHKECRSQQYIEKLPTVSVIFPFHDEHNSTLLRSVYSVINRSPPGVVREVILVDDASTKPALREPLTDYWRRVGLDHIVKVVRTQKREGVDSCPTDRRPRGEQRDSSSSWTPTRRPTTTGCRPCSSRSLSDYKTIVCPFVDVIDCDTFELRPQDEGARGSFDWHFNYKRLPLTKEDEKHPTRPFDSPVMAGGYFAISTKWFWELGGYDEGLDIWGGEQYELSFKVWQCHGRMVDAPCSRVGHIYRCKHKAIRERLQCKSFDWFMKNVAFDQDHYYPAIEPPDSASGELRNLAANKCVDTQFKNGGDRFELRKCISDDPSGGGEQNLRMSFWYDVRPKGRNLCFDVSTSTDHSPVVLFGCHGMKGNQHFKYKMATKQMHHPVSNLCMDCDVERGEIFMSRCDSSATTQKWTWAHLNETVMEERNKVQP